MATASRAGTAGTGAPRTGWALLLAALLVGVAAAAAPTAASAALRLASFALATLVAAIGVARNRPTPYPAWIVVAAGLGAATVSQLLWILDGDGDRVELAAGASRVASALNGIAYLGVVGAMFVIATHGQERRLRRARVLDALVVVTATAFVGYELIVDASAELDPTEATFTSIGLGHLVVTIAVGVLAAPVLRADRRARPAAVLLVLALASLVATNALFVVSVGTDRSLPWAAALNLSLVAVAAALLHPSIRFLAEHAPAPAARLTTRRLAIYGLAVVAPSATVGIGALAADGDVGSAVDLAIYLVIVSVLVHLRLRMLIVAAETAETRLDRHVALQDVVTRRTEAFVNIEPDEVGPEIDQTLSALGQVLDAEATYLLEWRHGALEGTHGWRRDGEPSEFRDLERLDPDRPSFIEMTRGRTVSIAASDDVPPSWDLERQLIGELTPADRLGLPMVADDDLIGILGLSFTPGSGALDDDVLELLRLVADVIGQALLGRRTELALAASEARHRSLVETAPDAILTIDDRGRLTSLNQGAERMTGWRADEVVGRDASVLVATPVRDLVLSKLDEGPIDVDAPAQTQREVEAIRKDGTRYPAEVAISAVDLPDGRAYTVVARDVSDRKRLESELIHQALHDPLTELANRTLLVEQLEASLRRARRSGSWPALLFIDLDRFKVVNDSLGHDAGDELLDTVARRLESALRGGDTAARLGGDEFVALCEDVTDLAHAVEVADRIRDAIAEPVVIDRAEIVVTASIGVVLAQPDDTASSLLRDADASMYRAKDEGRNRCHVFDDTVRRAAIERLAVERGLRRALAAGELDVHYQPQYAVSDLRPVGFEALLRWHHPTRGLLAPDAFLDVATEIGLDVVIDRWVLAEATRTAAPWVAEHPDLVLWVNLSARLLAEPDLADLVARDLELSGLPAANLGLEVTERALVRDLDAAARTLRDLRATGIHIAIDDFGTGFSSLSWLERLPLDTLKVDRSFTDGLGADRDDTVIVRSVVAMAHSLGLSALAEGVETLHQLEHLRQLGCDTFQGYLASRAVPASEIDPGRRAPVPAPPHRVVRAAPLAVAGQPQDDSASR